MAEMVQGSPEWLAERCGKVTASRIADMIKRTQNGWGAPRMAYLRELVAERLTGLSAPHFTSAEMYWGSENEPVARAAYEFRFDVDVVRIGFAPHPAIAEAGASPDGLVGADGLVEFKCPKTETHLDTWLSQTAPEQYVPQMQWQMACTGRSWCDFASYDPRVPDDLKLFVIRVARDEDLITALEEQAIAFLAEVADQVARLEAIGRRALILSHTREAA
ncbi:lambda exonuclease family protein [Methylobacterium oxalidis]|uniref:lambda exonuclease family protein n=1 Tax=Methylobacterium oxalidis TaxID=944322 RepID=UPI0033146C0A